jgi:predicted regulator of Ras-like GTPase activity (Roadblock/LC7/MglB family)
MSMLPTILYRNNISKQLDAIREGYIKLSGHGLIHGLMCVDQDAKIVAINENFDKNLNIWDLGALGAAMYGVSKQGADFFKSENLERADMIYGNVQFLVRSIGGFQLDNRGNRELLIVVLADKKVNIGLMILQMQKYAKIIKDEVEENAKIKETLKLSEEEMRVHIREIKNQLFKKAESLKMTV